jgi:hypothetical protein
MKVGIRGRCAIPLLLAPFAACSAPSGPRAVVDAGAPDRRPALHALREMPPLDVLGDTDENGAIRSPQWRFTLTSGNPPNPADPPCNRFPYVDATGAVQLQGCTSQNPEPEVGICSVKNYDKLSGHLDWPQPAASDGHIYWEGWSDDDDYNFAFEPGDKNALVLHQDAYETEFGGSEVALYIPTNLGKWSDFNRLARAHQDDQARQMLCGRPAVMMGLLNLDCAHDCQTELHPIFAMAVDVDETADNDHWIIMARNWGTTGFCHSPGDHQLATPDGKIYLHLTRPGATAVEILDDDFTAIPDGDLQADMTTNGGEVVVALTPVGARHGIVGQVVLRWTGGSAGPPSHASCAPPRTSSYRQPQPAGESLEDLEPEGQLRGALKGLTPAERKRFAQALTPPLSKRGKAILKKANRAPWKDSPIRRRIELEPHAPAKVTRGAGAPENDVLERKLRALCRLRGSFGRYAKACGAPP